MKRTLALVVCAALCLSACASSDGDVLVTGQLPPHNTMAADGGAGAALIAEASGETVQVGDAQTDTQNGQQMPGDTGVSGQRTPTTGDLLPIDPAVQIGTLENGLTYYVRSNSSPGGSLSLRLAVNAGSLNEPFAGAGYAHYLEHMLFNGTEKYPGNEITEALQSIGVEFGPDINAYTSFDETVYMLDLIIDEEENSVGTAFEVLAEWAHAATITEDDVDQERGIIRDEYRLREETGDGIISNVFNDLYTQNTPYEGRNPIGTVESILATTAQDLRDFYETWYVPSNMAVVAVGDLPVEELVGLVEQHFADIAAGESPGEVDSYSAIDHELMFANATSAEQTYPYLSLDIRLPSWDRNTVEGNRQLWIEWVVSNIVNSRLGDAYEQGLLSQIDRAFWESFPYTRGLRFSGTNLRAEDFSVALTDYWSLLLSLAEQGFSEVDRQIAVRTILSSLQSSVGAAATRQDADLADDYVSHFLEGQDISTPQDRLSRVASLLDELTVDDLSARYREILAVSEPIIVGVGSDSAEFPSSDELQAALDAAAPGELPTQLENVAFALESPDPVEPISEGPIEFLADELEDPYQWTFANGTRVIYAYSDISENEVILEASGVGGWSLFPEGELAIAQLLGNRAINSSGLGSYSRSELTAALAESVVTASAYVGETSEGVSGASDTAGTANLFELMYLYITAPRVDEQAFREAQDYGNILIALAASDPDVQEILALRQARHGDAYGWYNPIPSPERLESLTAQELLDIYRQRLGGVDDFTVIVIGDVERAEVARLAQTYVGTLPTKAADTYVDRRGPLPEGVVREEIVLGPDNSSTRATYIYELNVNPTLTQLVAGRLLNTILDAKLVENVRELLGDTYVATAGVDLSLYPYGDITATVLVTGPPEQMDNIEAEMVRIVGELHAGQIAPEEFERARSVMSDNLEVATNDDLLYVLNTWALFGGEGAITHQRLVDALAEMTLADVQELAALLLNPERHIQLVRVLG